jgi:cytochrome c553
LLLAAAATLFAGAAAAQDASRGAALAAARGCGACHGAHGVSAIPGTPSLAGQQPLFIVLQLILFREGLRQVPAMTPFAAGLDDGAIEDLAAHYAALPALPPPDQRPADPAATARGAALSPQHHCNVCHLPDYRGQNQVPRLVPQREEYLAAAMRAYRDQRRSGADTQMSAAVYGLSDADIEDLARYLAARR